MTRQSISLTQPSDNWLNHQVESQEYSSKSGLTDESKEEMLAQALCLLRQDGIRL